MNDRPLTALATRGGRAIKGEARAPGDKSISHRALIFGALAEGETIASGLLEGDDVLRTAAAMRALGAEIERDLTEAGPVWRVKGAPWASPERVLYFGNSGTGCRLVLGAAAGQRIDAAFDGDESLRKRPMRRVADPLGAMGAAIAMREGKLPLALSGARLAGIDYVLPVASAQVKSAVLLAGLGASGTTTVAEPERSRDHTERMLAAFGAAVVITGEGAGRRIAIKGGQRLKGVPVDVPGDPSSAAFIAAAAAIAPGSDVTLKNVLTNPLRAGFYQTLRDMGGDVAYLNERLSGGEPIADIRVRHAALKGVAVPASRAPSMIDEYPILAVVAAFAKGDTYMPGIEELRVKESDRLDAIEAGLSQNGVETESGPDWLRVFGRNGDVAGGGFVRTHLDHRIAMSFLVMGLAAAKAVTIDDASMIATSYPDFVETMRALGADIG
ncbi:MAG: 3-phosphoshikimate 1-carboxyvinyltransferase [Parvularculaceae bacterium]|nr:3-phosphoshikimate 1-carboxyvinyltransferase [Parvularculaceae bacterium]